MTHRDCLRLLFVDPNDDLREVMTSLFLMAGCTVETAATANDALARAERFLPDVVICEIMLGDAGGIEFSRQLRSLPYGKNVVLIGLTATYTKDIESRATGAGFGQLLTKPASINQLIEALRPVAEVRGCAVPSLE